MLDSWITLYLTLQGLSMASGAPKLIRIRLVLLVVLMSIGAAIEAAAQQPATNSQSAPNSTPPKTEVFPSAAQPVANGAGEQENTPEATTANNPPVTTLGPGDLFDLTVYNVPELATKARVSLSGDVYLPLIDYVHVSGLTQEEAQALIEKRLADGGFVRNPHVTIFMDEANSQGVTVIGDVGKPGTYPDPASRKLYQVISEAGGFLTTASRKIAIIRPNQPEAIPVNLPRNLSDDLSQNVEVLPGDTINVPRAPVIYVVGDVGHPSAFLVDNGRMTVLEALALAGGTNHTAKLSAARIIHKTPAGMTESSLQLKKMLEAKTPDVTLQADDILFVPISGLKVAAMKTVDVAATMASAIAVYTVVR
jgi:polysaccharide biosynthesis/export protein